MTRQTTRMMFSSRARLVALLASTALVNSTAVLAQSLPTGGQVAAGRATIGTPSAGALTINQTSGSAVVNWQSFNVGKGNRVTFVQPDANSAILNRVTSQTTSTIAGQINANGQVYLINPNGIAITNTGTVKTGAFVASTLGISDDDFMAGKRRFTGNGASAPVTNAGAITINRAGYMALIGGTVANSGVITVPMGKAALGSGEQATLDLSGDGFLQVAVPTKAGGNQALVTNSGKISARGGTVQLSAAAAKDMARQAVNMSGTIEAKGVSGRSGDIVLSGSDGEVAISGKIDARSKHGAGGKVAVTGRKITLAGAKINASGNAGGGTVNIGGERQGKGTLPRAETLTVDANTVINADALVSGNGGNVVLWSDELTRFAGTITAKGGALSGNGGEAEVSGKAQLSYTGLTDLTAAYGAFGNLLLDPYNVTISTGTNSNSSGFTASGNDSVINVNTLTNALALANVTVSTGATGSAGSQAGNITVTAPFSWSSGSTLALNAAGSLAVNSAITVGGSGSLNLNAAGGGVQLNKTIGVTGAGAVNVTAAPLTGVSTTGLTFALGASIDYGATNNGGAFTLNGTSYTLVYSMANLDAIDGVNATNGAAVTVYGAGANGNYTLATNLDASGISYNRQLLNFTFGGKLDGLGHTVSNMAIGGGLNNNGFIAALSGTLSNFGMVGGSAFGNLITGTLVGTVNGGGVVQTSYSTASLYGSSNVGGLVGSNGGTIQASFATGNVVTGGQFAGGLAGRSSGIIINSFASGSVNAGQFAGGLVGQVTGGSIRQSLFTGVVTGGGEYRAGIAGYIAPAVSPGSVGGLYWDTQTSGTSTGAGYDVNRVGQTTGLTTALLQNGALPSGLPSTIWATGNGLYPYLTNFFPNGVQAISGIAYGDSGVTVAGSNSNGPQYVYLDIGGIRTAVTTGVNGYYYAMLPNGTLSSANGGTAMLAYTLQGNVTGPVAGAYLSTATGTTQNIDIWANTLIAPTTATRLSTAPTSGAALLSENGGANQTLLAAAVGTDTAAANISSLTLAGYIATGSSGFNVDQGISAYGLYLQSLNGPITVSAAQTLGGPINLTLLSAGALSINAPIQVNGAGALTLGYDASSPANLSFGLTGAGFSGGLTFANADGSAATSSQGGTLSINRSVYKLLYSLADLDGIDGVAASGNAINVQAGGLSGNYALAANLDASGIAFTDALIGTNSSGNASTWFTGTFNGLGHRISGLTVNKNGSYAGLFGYVGTGGLVRNVSLLGGAISGQTVVGGLAGRSDGTILQASAGGAVNGTDWLGGIVGYNAGAVSLSYATGAVSGSGRIGGLVGDNVAGASIVSSYAYGAVTGTAGSATIGGLVGSNEGTIAQAYAIGPVGGSAGKVGGLIGYNSGGVTAGVFNTQTSGQTAGVGQDIGNASGNVVGLNTASFQAGTLPAGFSSTIWATGFGLYPYLKSFYPDGVPVASGTAPVGSTVHLRTDTGAIVTASVAADGSYYSLLPSDSIGAGGSSVLIWSTGGASDGATFQTGVSATRISNFNITGGLQTDITSLATLSALNSAYTTVNDGTNGAGSYANRLITAGGSFTIDGALNAAGSVIVSAAGNLIIDTDGTVGGASATLLATEAFINNRGADAVTVNGGRWLVYSATSGGDTFGDLDSGNSAVWSTAAGATVSATGNRYVFAEQPILTVATINQDKIYGVDDTANPGNYYAITGISTGVANAYRADTLAGIVSGAASLTSSGLSATTGVGQYSYTLGLGTLAAGGGYGLVLANTGNVTVTPKTLTIVADAKTKIYGDANPALTYSILGLVNNDGVSGSLLTAAGQYSGAGTYGITNGFTASSNYTIDYTGANLTVGQRVISLSGNRTYDGSADLAASLFTLSNLAGNETLTLSGTGTMADKNAGSNKSVTLASLALGDGTGGGLASNYTLIGGADTVDIAKATISSIGGITAIDKTYDGGMNASVNTGDAILNGKIGNDVLGVTGAIGLFNDQNAGSGKAVSITGLALAGADSGNYTLTSSTATTLANIGQRVVNLSGSRIYNGTTDLAASIFTLSNLVGSETLTLSGTGTMVDKNAGSGKGVTLASLVLSDGTGGGLASNYVLASGSSAVDISKAIISSIGGVTAGNKTYSGTTAATLDTSDTVFSGMITGDALTVGGGTGTFSDKNAGTGKMVGITGLSLGGADAGNYTLASNSATTMADIAKAYVFFSAISAGNKVYDGTTAATVNIFTVPVVGSDDMHVGYTSANFSDKNAGNYKAVAIDGLYITGADAGNYQLGIGSYISHANITPAVISSISGIAANGKPYDGNADATLNTSNAIFNGMILGDGLTVGGGTGAFADANAGTGKTVSISGLSLGGADAGNYRLSLNTATALANIGQRVISLSGDRAYDGTTALDNSIFTLSNLVGGETLTLLGIGAMGDKNAGSGKAVTLGSLVLGNGAGGGLASNYTLSGSTDTVDIAKAVISIGGITAGNKTYDGTTAATLDSIGVTFNGMVLGDSLNVGNGFAGAFADANAGTGKTVTISGLSLRSSDAANYTLASNSVTTTADIGQRVISLAGSRTYNGSTDLDNSIFTMSNLASGETLTLSGTGAMGDKNAGSGKAATLGSLTLGNGQNGGLASNYTLIGGNDAVDIDKAVISSIGGIAAGNKTYDGLTGAMLNTGGAIFNGIIGNDVLSLAGGTGAFSDQNAGRDKTVTISGLTLGGADARNYTLASSAAETPATIAQRVIDLSGGRTYNGSADLSASMFTLSNLLGNETLTLSGIGSMADKNAGSGKAMALGTLALGDGSGGGLASNYTLAGGADTVDIAKAVITSIGGIAAGDKTYDGSTGVTLDTSAASVNGIISGDRLTVAGALGAFLDANAGFGKTVTVSGLSLAGADAGNYTLASSTSTSLANIGQRVISLSGSRTYNGSTDLDASIFTLANLVTGERLTLSGTGSMADKNAGSKTVALGTLLLGNGSGNNAGLASNYTLVGGPDAVDIAKAVISSIGGITAGVKSYDGTTAVGLNTSDATFNGMIGNDSLSLGNGVIGAFSDANAGAGKTVTISGLSLAGADADNYTLASSAATTLADIGRRVISFSGSRTYNGSTDLDASIFTLSNVVTGETLTLSGNGSMADKNVGDKGVTLGSLLLGNGTGGGLTTNYTLAGGADTVNIVKAVISSIIGITAGSKGYDGSTGATLNTGGAIFNGMITGDTLALGNGMAGAFADQNAGSAKTVNISGLSLGGADAGNYTLASNTATTLADIARRALTVTTTAESRIYGNANPTLTYTVGGAGLVAGESLSGTLATNAIASSNVGTYRIDQGSLAASGNYALSFTGGTFAVTPRAITVAANNIDRIYGDANPALSYAIGGEGLVNNDMLTGALATSATGISNVGSYAITQGTLAASGNYALTFTGADLAIGKRAITVAANGLNRIYGDTNPILSYTIGGAGLVNNDGLTGALATAANLLSGAGTYGIAKGSLAASGNYDLTFTGGRLAVTPRAITVAASDASRAYGDQNPVFGYTANGLVNADRLTGSLAAAANPFSNVGFYAITQGTLGNANYAISYDGGNLTIVPRAIIVTASNASRSTGADNPAFGYTIGGAGIVNGDRLFGELTTIADRRSGPGSYAIIQGSLAASGNYDMSFVGGVLTVTAVPSSPTTDLASAIVARSFAPDTTPLPPARGGDGGTFSLTNDGPQDFLTDPRFAGTVVCIANGAGCVVQPAP